VPLFWPMIAGLQMAEKGLDLYFMDSRALREAWPQIARRLARVG
jgi:hypothetical protein